MTGLYLLIFFIVAIFLFYPFFTNCNKCNKSIPSPTTTKEQTINLNIDQPTSPSFRDLRTYNWWDFHKCSGKSTYAPGTLPTFGLWTNKDNLITSDCKKRSFDWPYELPCTSTNYGFPVECGNCVKNSCTGTNCRIRGPLEDSIYWM